MKKTIFGLLVLSSVAPSIASAQKLTIGDALAAIRARVPNIQWNSINSLEFHGTTSDGKACRGNFSSDSKTELSIHVERDTAPDQDKTADIDLNETQTVDDVSMYTTINSINSSPTSLTISMVTYVPGSTEPTLPASHLNQELQIEFDKNGAMTSVSATEQRGLLGLFRQSATCLIQNQ